MPKAGFSGRTVGRSSGTSGLILSAQVAGAVIATGKHHWPFNNPCTKSVYRLLIQLPPSRAPAAFLKHDFRMPEARVILLQV
jgi:hypothetical protein